MLKMAYKTDDNDPQYDEVRLEFRCERAREFVEDLLTLCQLEIIENLPSKINSYAKVFDMGAFLEYAQILRAELA